MLATGLDYVSVTVRDRSKVLPEILRDMPYVEGKPRYGYTEARRYQIGTMVYSNADRYDMGVHVVYSGSVLATISEMFTDPLDVLAYHVKNNATVSRIDVRMDIVDEEFSIEELAEAYQRGEIETLARRGTNVQGMTDAGHTLYVGSLKKRKKLLRVYDKFAQSPLSAIAERHKRIELEVHGKPATMLAADIVSAADTASAIRGAIKGYAHFPTVEAWARIFADDSAITYGSYTHVQSNSTQKWLLDQCIPALAKELKMDSGFMTRFMEALTKELYDIGAIESL